MEGKEFDILLVRIRRSVQNRLNNLPVWEEKLKSVIDPKFQVYNQASNDKILVKWNEMMKCLYNYYFFLNESSDTYHIIIARIYTDQKEGDDLATLQYICNTSASYAKEYAKSGSNFYGAVGRAKADI
jgi:hypothetical protein